MKQWTLRIVGVLAILALAGFAAYALYRKHEFRNIRGSSSVEFVTTQARQAGPPEGVAWPRYGFDLAVGARDRRIADAPDPCGDQESMPDGR